MSVMDSNDLTENEVPQRWPLAVALWQDNELQVFASSRWSPAFVIGAIVTLAWFLSP